ncbi:MAG TPA: hypothetical protein VGM50_22085 [Gemmatimonadaceae bacterium]|jgi:hypothetical protein
MASILSRCVSAACAVLIGTSASSIAQAQAGAAKSGVAQRAAQGAAAPRVAAPNTSTTLELIGLNGKKKTLKGSDLAAMPHVDATVSSHGVTGTYSGVPLGALLHLIDRPTGEALRGASLATAVSVEASDKYRVIFALAEVDSGFTNKTILVADKKNGAAMDAMEGPFRVIVPDEARPARWAKQVVRIRLIPVK